MTIKKILPILLVAFAVPAVAQVRTFVSSSGSDTNPCSQTQPCRNFAAAIAAVNPNGEVVALDTAGYGPFTITSSVTVVAPPAVHAAIAPTLGNAITVNAPGAVIVLRGLFLNSQGATIGVQLDSAQSLSLESIHIGGFDDGVYVPATSGYLSILDSEIRDCGDSGVEIAPESAGYVRGVLDNVRLLFNDVGISVGNAQVTITDSTFNTYNASATGIAADNGASVNVRSSSILNGFNGVYADGTSIVRLSDTNVSYNAYALRTVDVQAQIISLRDNAVVINSANTTFSSDIPLQ